MQFDRALQKELAMLLALIVITFVMTTVIVLGVYLVSTTETTQEVVRGRIAQLQASNRWAGIATDLRLVRDDLFSTVPALHKLLSQAPGAMRLQKYITQAGMKTKPAKLVLVSVVIAAATYSILGQFIPIYFAFAIAIPLFFIPLGFVAWNRKKRLNKFEELFPDALDMLGRAVRAGHALSSAMELVVKESPEPVAGEFSITFDEQNYGIPMRDALMHMADRVPTFDVRFLVTAIIVQRESGGNLAELLDQMSGVIRERFRIRRDVQVKTALGRMTAGILMSLPIGMLFLLSFVNPEYEDVLFHDPYGPYILAAAATLQIIGGLILWRIVQIEV
jgi:tight adherence protein B